MRARAGASIDTLFPSRAPLVRALLIADQDDIDPQLRDVYAEAGLVHLLSISGLHVAIIAEALLIVTTAMRLSRTAASISSLVVIAGYVLLLGAPPSAVRSAVMLSTITLSEGMQRPVHPWTALALGAWIPTIDPAVVVHLGWQLSVGGMAALVAAREIMRRIRHYERRGDIPGLLDKMLLRMRRLRGWRKLIVRELVTGVIATAVTAPIIAWSFGRISVVAPLSNIVAGPIVAFLQPALFLALLLAPLHAVATLVADACALPLTLLDMVAGASARVPYAALRIAPGLAGALFAGLASALFVRATASRRMTPGLLAACVMLVLGFWSPVLLRTPGTMQLHMIDVGQGDAVALRTPRGRWIIFDAGRSWQGGDAGRRVVVPYIRRLGGDVAAFVLSHAHDDHVGGAPSVIEALRPARWIEPAYITTTTAYRSALKALQLYRIPWKRVHPADSIRIDGVLLRVLGPDSAWTVLQSNPNEASVVVMAEYRGARFLFTGDAEEHEEAWMVSRWGDELDADVLKLGHHGSRTSSSAAFVDKVTPVLGLASVGAANRYGHPSPETLLAFHSRGIPILRTDREGSIVVEADGRRLVVATREDKWTIPLR
jgi:competence protein ComEC